MENPEILTDNQLCERWQVTAKTTQRMRQDGRLPWLDLTQGRLRRPTIRYRLQDVLRIENKTLCPVVEGNYDQPN